jgi:hypothetical protein
MIESFHLHKPLLKFSWNSIWKLFALHRSLDWSYSHTDRLQSTTHRDTNEILHIFYKLLYIFYFSLLYILNDFFEWKISLFYVILLCSIGITFISQEWLSHCEFCVLHNGIQSFQFVLSTLVQNIWYSSLWNIIINHPLDFLSSNFFKNYTS